jgi:hypothetical protein
MRSLVVACRGSYVTTASFVSSPTFTRLTPFTASSADRTAVVQPSHIMPDTTRVTVFGCAAEPPLPGRPLESRHAAAMATPNAVKSSRLVSDMEQDHRPNQLFRQSGKRRL